MKTRRVMVLAGVLAAGLFGGCNARTANIHAIRLNPSPEVSTLYQRRADVLNAITVTFDENWRMFNQDLGRALYWDRPSRLTPETMPH